MKPFHTIATLLLLMAFGAASVQAQDGRRYRGHSHSHARVGIHIGIPLATTGYFHGYYGPRYYGPRYYAPAPYYPPSVLYYPPAYAPIYAPVLPSAPLAAPVYIERAPQAASGVLEPGYWYYCDSPAGYYPTVRECPGGWQQIAPAAP